MLTIKRLQLDAIIAQAAVAAGARLLCDTAVVDIKQEDDTVLIYSAGDSVPIRARMCVVATGAHVTLGKKMDIISDARPNAVAVRCYVTSPIELDRLIFSYEKEIIPGYGWIFPLPNGEFNIGCGVLRDQVIKSKLNLHSVFDRFVSIFPLAGEIMRSATHVSQLIGAPLRCGFVGTRSFRRDRVLAIGESIGTTFPFTGEGIGKAMESAELAAEIIHHYLCSHNQAVLADFDHVLKAKLEPKYTSYRAAEKWLAKPWLNDFLARKARKSRYIQQCLVGCLEETFNPRELLSWRGLLNVMLNR